MSSHEQYMYRCIELAQLGKGCVAPNPMVGAVLVHKDRIIGEGYHQQYGQGHAEVNCLKSVAERDLDLVEQSTLYVSLEPCAHFGKTPPCANLIIDKKIPKVVVGCKDPFEQVAGKGIEKLQQAGVEVMVGVLERECLELNKRFFTFHLEKRPYVVLKWAQSSNGAIASNGTERILISNEITNRLVHQWRSEEAGILVGARTALLDNPSLNARLSAGKNPIRIVIDLDNNLPADLKIFNQQQDTIIINCIEKSIVGRMTKICIPKSASVIEEVLKACYQKNIQSILVEGGTKTLQAFIDAGLWDEARVIENETLVINDGYAAPVLNNSIVTKKEQILTDRITYYKKHSTASK